MGTPVRISRGCVQYTGTLAALPFRSWTDSADGRQVVAHAALRRAFAPFGRARAARRSLWRDLVSAASDPATSAAIQWAMDGCLPHLGTLAYARDLPRLTIELRRLVTVPRLFLNGDLYRRLDAGLREQPAYAAIEGGDSLRSWFLLQLVEAVEAAIVQAQPSANRPLQAGRTWIVVGVDDSFDWGIALEGPVWRGHYYMLEVRPVPLTRAVRKQTRAAITSLEGSVRSLSAARRSEILRTARLSLDERAI
jgi:hypothetical protein